LLEDESDNWKGGNQSSNGGTREKRRNAAMTAKRMKKGMNVYVAHSLFNNAIL